jgi:hypothetical protein
MICAFGRGASRVLGLEDVLEERHFGGRGERQ